MKNLMQKLTLFSLFLTVLLAQSNYGQGLTTNVDIVSRYVWRGLELGSGSPSLQPSVKYTTGGFQVGFWGAYPLADGKALDEIDLFASYTLSLGKAGSFNVGFTDYTNPNSGKKLGDFSSDYDSYGLKAHSAEINATYTLPESFPLSIGVNVFAHGVKNSPLYLQLGYLTSVNEIAFNLFVGATPGESNKYYGVEKFSVNNIGFTATKPVKITESFGFSLFSTVALNPATEHLYYVIGLSL